MKLWRFYKIPEKEYNEIQKSKGKSVEERYNLYAFTNNKKLAKAFIKTRNMKAFLIRKSDDLEREEYIDFVNNNRGEELVEKPIPTAINKFTSKQEKIDVKLCITFNEYQVMESLDGGILSSQEYWMSLDSPDIFRSKYRKLLSYFDYGVQHKLMTGMHPLDDEEDDYSAPDFRYDNLAIFLAEYAHLFALEDENNEPQYIND